MLLDAAWCCVMLIYADDVHTSKKRGFLGFNPRHFFGLFRMYGYVLSISCWENSSRTSSKQLLKASEWGVEAGALNLLKVTIPFSISNGFLLQTKKVTIPFSNRFQNDKKVGTQSAPPSPRFPASASKLSPLARPEIPTNQSPSMLVGSGENNVDWAPHSYAV